MLHSFFRFFPRQTQEGKTEHKDGSSREEEEKDKDEVVNAIVIVRHYLVLIFLLTVLMTIDVANTEEIDKLLQVESENPQQPQQSQQPQQPQQPQKKACNACGATDKPLSVCSRCKKAFYCSRECQKNDW